MPTYSSPWRLWEVATLPNCSLAIEYTGSWLTQTYIWVPSSTAIWWASRLYFSPWFTGLKQSAIQTVYHKN
jgi:hypothetical protein